MKILFSYIQITAICFLLVSFSHAEAAEHISTGRMLEFSLRNLKESIVKTRQKNERLAFENDALRKDIRYMQQVLENLNRNKGELLSGEKMPAVRSDPYAIAGSYDMAERRRRTRELADLFQEDVLRLNEEMHLLDKQIKENSYTAQREQVLNKKEASTEFIARSEKKLRSLKKKAKEPQHRLEQLRQENDVLKQQLEILKEKFAGF